MFSSCLALTTILADPMWALPASCSGLQTFYSSKALVGDNGEAQKKKLGSIYSAVQKRVNEILLWRASGYEKR